MQGPDPEGGDGGGNTDRATNDLRFRTTRSSWDRQYKDESLIKEAVDLIPRMKDLIAENHPGCGFQIGEYNFRAEKHIAGGVALAEALGRFARFGVSHAFYWTYRIPSANGLPAGIPVLPGVCSTRSRPSRSGACWRCITSARET